MVEHSSSLTVEQVRRKRSPATPHLLAISGRIQFAVYCVRSLLVAASRLISFPSGTKTFQFPELQIRKDRAMHTKSHSGISGSTAACASPEHIVACHALHLLSNRVIHLMESECEGPRYLPMHDNMMCEHTRVFNPCVCSPRAKHT